MAEKTTEASAGGPATGKTGGMTKLEAVRRALAKLGNEAKPTEIQGYVKKEFNIDMSTDHISTSKGAVQRAARAKAGAKPAARATSPKPVAPRASAAGSAEN